MHSRQEKFYSLPCTYLLWLTGIWVLARTKSKLPFKWIVRSIPLLVLWASCELPPLLPLSFCHCTITSGATNSFTWILFVPWFVFCPYWLILLLNWGQRVSGLGWCRQQWVCICWLSLGDCSHIYHCWHVPFNEDDRDRMVGNCLHGKIANEQVKSLLGLQISIEPRWKESPPETVWIPMNVSEPCTSSTCESPRPGRRLV